MMFHYGLILGETAINDILLTDYAGYAVEFFFLLSGFFMAYNYKERIAKMTFGEFVNKKIKKSYLQYVAACAFAIIVSAVEYLIFKTNSYAENFDIKDIILTVLLLKIRGFNGNPFGNVTWFVCVLICCYILFYLVCRLSKNNIIYRFFCLLLIVLGIACIANGKYPLLTGDYGRGYLSFFLGCILWELEFHIECSERYRKAISVFVMIYLIVGIIILVLLSGEHLQIILTLCIYPALLYILLHFKPLIRVLTISRIQQLGSLSMPIYYSHYTFLVIVAMISGYGMLNIRFSESWIEIAIIFIGIILGYVISLISKYIKKVTCNEYN